MNMPQTKCFFFFFDNFSRNIIDNEYHFQYKIDNEYHFQVIKESMLQTNFAENKVMHPQDRFTIQVENTTITLCIHQLMKMLVSLQQRQPTLFEFSLQASLAGKRYRQLQCNEQYKLCFGKTILILRLPEVIELLVQMWHSNPMLMHWVASQAGEEM